MSRILFLGAIAAALICAVGTVDASRAAVVINEIYADGNGYYDGAEFIELYNTSQTVAANISGYVLAGTEHDQTCAGEDAWAFPSDPPTVIPPNGYLIVTKDGHDGDDGFFEEFGFNPDFEMYDETVHWSVPDVDHPDVANMILVSGDSSYSDEVELVGGTGYGVMCGSTSHSDVVRLYESYPLTVVLDLVEYMDPVYCTTDPCPGDDGADDNAWQGVIFLGNTLGRDPSGTDTNMSIDDFSLQAPTPGLVNTTSPPPWIRTVRYSPIPPNNADPTTISAVITDDGTLDTVRVYYRPEGGIWGAVNMSAVNDTVYAGNISPLPNNTIVEYFVRAVDDQGSKINYPAFAFADPFSYRVGTQTIYQVQFPGSDSDNPSQLEGQPANVEGWVTAAKGTFSDSYFFIHEGSGAYEGIKIYASGVDTEVLRGDFITACGRVTEYNDETEIYLHFPEALVVHSHGASPHGPAAVTTAQVAPENPDAEQYEGQLVKITNADVTATPDTYYDWKIRDASATDAKVGDYGYYSYYPKVGDDIDELTAVLTYYYNTTLQDGWFVLEPRDDGDIVGPPRIRDLVYSPIPPVAGGVTISAECLSNRAVGATLHYAIEPSTTFLELPMSLTTGVTHEATIPNLGNGDRVDYYVVCTEGSMVARKPPDGSYDFYVGTVSIYDVQYVPDPATNDASQFVDEAINVHGIVTAEPGVYSDYYFYIQDGEGEWNGVKVYERTGSISLSRGDGIIVCGDVWENYNETEIAMHFPESYSFGGGDPVSPHPTMLTNTNALQQKSTGEKYEGVLVGVDPAIVIDANLGFGEWAITNAAPEDTCRVDDDAEYTYTPVEGDTLIVVGVVAFTYGNYKIEPREGGIAQYDPVGVPGDEVGFKFGLHQNSPNPFNPLTRIAFSLGTDSEVRLEVFDVAGRKVRTLVDKRLTAGPHEIVWDGRTDVGERAASGVFFCKLAAGDKDAAKKMVLLK